MSGEETAQIDHNRLRSELCNWLRLMEISGTGEILLDRGLYEDTGSLKETMGSSTGPADSLSAIREAIASCRRCDLHGTRTNTVFGEGNPSTDIMFIGEGPGRDEDLQGRPFVGRAGMLLTKIIEAMGLMREDVYITNVVKCRPPGNRNPDADEISECLPFLEKQVNVIGPKVICTLGLVATQTITGSRSGITAMRGRYYDYNGIMVMPTFHPAACLRNPSSKRLVWEDVKKIMKTLGLPVQGVMRNGPGKNKHRTDSTASD
jgi:uracil-DNA glycosylase family 4